MSWNFKREEGEASSVKDEGGNTHMVEFYSGGESQNRQEQNYLLEANV